MSVFDIAVSAVSMGVLLGGLAALRYRVPSRDDTQDRYQDIATVIPGRAVPGEGVDDTDR